MCCHPKCKDSLPNNCGLPEELAGHLFSSAPTAKRLRRDEEEEEEEGKEGEDQPDATATASAQVVKQGQVRMLKRYVYV